MNETQTIAQQLSVEVADDAGRRIALAINRLLQEGSAPDSVWRDLVLAAPQRAYVDGTAYQEIHEKNELYQINNWLLSELEILKPFVGTRVLEIGCGNGKFLRAVAPFVSEVIGVDFAVSPLLESMPLNVRVSRADLMNDNLPSADLCVSADVLEHIPPNAIRQVLSKVHRSAPRQYHAIACYDDGSTHQTVMAPHRWLALFLEHSPDYAVVNIVTRQGSRYKPVVYITNIRKITEKIGNQFG
jgi:SAM-dependent methyltransferase